MGNQDRIVKFPEPKPIKISINTKYWRDRQKASFVVAEWRLLLWPRELCLCCGPAAPSLAVLWETAIALEYKGEFTRMFTGGGGGVLSVITTDQDSIEVALSQCCKAMGGPVVIGMLAPWERWTGVTRINMQ